MFPLLAIMHSLLFWFSVSFLTPLILLVGLFTPRKQLLHDLILGTVVVNSAALHRMSATDGRPFRPGRLGVILVALIWPQSPGMTHQPTETPQFYLTAPSPCPYLPGRSERKVFTHLVGDRAGGAQRHPHPGRLPP